MDVNLSSCIVLLIMHITSDVYYTQGILTLISTNAFQCLKSCQCSLQSFDWFLPLWLFLWFSGSVAHTLWSPRRSVTGILMWQRCRVGQPRSPADGVGITRTAERLVRCSMTSVEAANISSQNTSAWDYQVKLNRSGSRIITSMR